MNDINPLIGKKHLKEIRHPMVDPIAAMRMKKGKIVTAEEAIDLIRDDDTIVTAGFVGAGFAEELAIALKARFLKTGRPRNLTLTYPAGQGDGKTSGIGNHRRPSHGGIGFRGRYQRRRPHHRELSV